ncbi:MAG: fused MFS/spermidine synthase [Gammaproteobacteria bacterium]
MSARAPLALYALLFLSGSAGLAYQSIWTKTFALALGHEMPSLLGVVAAFFAGLSAGSWSLGQRIGRTARPHQWYAGCEIVIAVAALATPVALPLASNLAGELLGVAPAPVWHWAMAFAIPFVVLLPATFAMGVTLPAMEQVIARRSLHGRVVAAVYAANTAGAVAGVLICVFVALPVLGQTRTLWLFAAVNIMCAAGALYLGQGASRELMRAPDNAVGEFDPKRVAPLLLLTGLLGVGYEVLAVRILSQVFEATLYSFATALAVYLAASSAGAALLQRTAAHAAPGRWLGRLLSALALSCLAGLGIMFIAEPIYRALRLSLGDSAVHVFQCEMLLALSVFAVPSFLMGMIFALLAQIERERSGHIGRAMGINTLGAALAPLVFGIGLLPSIGAKWSVGMIALGYLWLGGLAFCAVAGRSPVRRIAALTAGAAGVIFLLPALQIMTLRNGEEVVVFKEGVLASTAVVQQGNAKNLRVNNRYQMGGTTTGALLFQRRQAHVPLLLHPSPDNALFLGVASGVTVGTAAQYESMEIDAVELVPNVLDLLDHFAPANGAPHRRENVTLYASDARRFVQFAPDQYDVIVADLYHPARDGAGLLFSQEHYLAIRNRLAPDGVFCHWLPFHQLDMDMIRLVVRTYQSVFPDAHLVLASDMLRFPALGLVTGLKPRDIAPGYLKTRVPSSSARAVLQRDLLTNELQLLATILLDTEALTQIAGEGPLNTDDLPHLSYAAPRFTYDRGSKPYGRLMAILNASQASAQRMAQTADRDASFTLRWQKFVLARNRYLQGMQVHMEQGERAAVAHYIASARTSADFNTSFSQLFKIAHGWSESAPEDALEIATELRALRPDIKPVDDLVRRLSRRQLDSHRR